MIAKLALQYLRRREGDCKNPLDLLQNNEISLCTEEYDASKSEMMLTLVPEDQQAWKSYMNTPTVVVGFNIPNISNLTLLSSQYQFNIINKEFN